MVHVKRPEDRLRRNTPKPLEANDSDIPQPPKGLSPALLTHWDNFWSSPAASLVDPDSDLLVVTRLFRLYGFAEETMARMDARRELPANEVSSLVRLSGEIRMLEGSLGLSPRARFALGVTSGKDSEDLDGFLSD